MKYLIQLIQLTESVEKLRLVEKKKKKLSLVIRQVRVLSIREL